MTVWDAESQIKISQLGVCVGRETIITPLLKAAPKPRVIPGQEIWGWKSVVGALGRLIAQLQQDTDPRDRAARQNALGQEGKTHSKTS